MSTRTTVKKKADVPVEVTETSPVETYERKYDLRKLKSDDIFTLCTLIKHLGIKDLKKVFNVSGLVSGGQVDVEAIGADIAIELLELIVTRLPECKDEIYEFASSASGMTVERIADLSMVEFGELVYEIITCPDFKDFFRLAQRFLK